ncbi:MAG: polyribonucleotide nucleotidyltransferase [Simkaniaceae bacterium]|nr:polyribonucleotide nucleotidyltransferase [Candidatus Sacchlamyda saccharinae]
MNKESMSVSIGGREISFETGKIARQANGSVILRSGDTMLLGTACASDTPLQDVDFLPLRVDYQEKFSSTGKTLGGYLKREGRPTQREILTCRLIDRPLRPLFEKGWYHDTQLLSYVLSYDGVHTPEPLAICALSAALVISDIPLVKPVGAVQVGLVGERLIINPTFQEMENSRLDLMLAGTEDAILMIEGYADFLTEEQVLEAVEEGHKAIQQICRALSEWQNLVGKDKRLDTLRLPSEDILKDVEAFSSKDLEQAVRIVGKQERDEKISEINAALLAKYCPEEAEATHPKNEVMAAFKKSQARAMREMILKENVRSDGRQTDQVRPISIDMGYLPRTHGSSVFTRGETQAVAVATLGGDTMAQRYESLNGEGGHRFYLQYFFPPFSVGEVGRFGPPGRREVGHGKLAERSLAAALPSADDFPYVIRLESNITESNGSSSMASVCGGCLAMMDAGIPLKHPVAGIAMGLILEGEKYAILSDILGAEDALGDMDFKIAGNDSGITAFQLDIKIEGITPQIMKAALTQAKQGRLHILQKMMEACPKPREQLSAHAPRIETVKVKPSKIGMVIGPGGKQIREIIEVSGAEINIDDDGVVSIVAATHDAMEKAKEMIHNITAEAEVGKVYKGKIVSIVPFGVFVSLVGQQEGLCHISELSHERIEDIRKKGFKEGQELEVKVLEIDDRGKVRLSHKVLLEAPAK